MAIKVEIADFRRAAEQRFNRTALKHDDIKEIARANDWRIPGELWKVCKAGPGLWDLARAHGMPSQGLSGEAKPAPTMARAPAQALDFGGKEPVAVDSIMNYVPQVNHNYVAWGNMSEITQIMRLKIFYPVYVTGLSGNGKTSGVIQCAAAAGREIIRVNITAETDEDDLIGGFRLVNGNTEWQDGPVVIAMKRGAILLLDEIDLATHLVMCLQPILEGEGIYIKKINTQVYPAKGFTVIATANTKGRGADSGKFVGTNIMNEAMLDRFAITLEQDYPGKGTETKILQKLATSIGLGPESRLFVDALVSWAGIIRKTFQEGGCDDVVSTRRLIDAVKAYAIFGDITKAINLVTGRFDADTKQSFLELWNSVGGGLAPQPEEVPEEAKPQATANKVPF